MSRLRTPSALTFVVGTLLASGFVVLNVLAMGTGGCASQETTGAPDASPPPCKAGPFIFCQPVGAEVASCDTDDGNSRWLTRLPRATRYPLGCVVNYVGERDESGDCKLEAACKCVIGEIPGTAPPASDGGANGDGGPGDGGAGDGGDAGTAPPPPPPPPPAVTGPVWNCYP